MSTILLINGPNLSILGKREPEVYGNTTLAQLEDRLTNELQVYNLAIKPFQSNGEKELIDFIEANYDALGAIINPGALMMNGWCLHDALENFPRPWIEVHISNIAARESFRHHSILSPIASGVISGCGVYGYVLAVKTLANMLDYKNIN